jgi:hypothetical protein
MMKKHLQLRKSDSRLLIIFSFLLFIIIPGCRREEGIELYHQFPDKVWNRFNILKFEIPFEKPGTYEVGFFARLTHDFPYPALGFNMIMNTPSGEERTNEYEMAVKSPSGDFCIECTKDSCTGYIILKKEINFDKPGILKVEIENLTPRLITEGVLGVGIRLKPSEK